MRKDVFAVTGLVYSGESFCTLIRLLDEQVASFDIAIQV